MSTASVLGLAAIGGIALKSGLMGSCGSCLATTDTSASVAGSASTTAVAFTGPKNGDGVESMRDSTRLSVGDTMPAFRIPTPVAPGGDESLTLSEALADGPLVITFFRGSWCPYCRGELSEIQDNLGKFEALGTSVLAISPQRPRLSADGAEKHGYGFRIAHDENNALAKRLGLAFTVDEDTIEKYRGYGIDIPKTNGNDAWELPVPATYIVDQDRTVRYVYDNEDYTKRADPDDILEALERVADEG